MDNAQPSKRRPVLLATAAILIVAAVGWTLYSSQSTDPLTGSGAAFYSIDDGHTFFKADSANIPPFTHDGKQAVQAMVYTSDGGKTKFVGYLMRFTTAGAERIKKMRADAQAGRRVVPGMDPELQANSEVKRPGEKTWTKLSNTTVAAEVMNVRSPSDRGRLADPVDP